MAKKQHLFEQVSQELSGWVDETAKAVAEGFMDGPVAPFAANITEAEKLDVYRPQVFLPNGAPNLEGRLALQERVGVEGYARILLELDKTRRRGLDTTPPPGRPAPAPPTEDYTT